jgi:hypothetical protein
MASGKPQPKKSPRPTAEMWGAFDRRVRFLEASAANFDAGDDDEAYRMALELRALLHYGQSKPLLHHLGIIKKLSYVDSAPEPPPGVVFVASCGLTMMRMAAGDPQGSGEVPRLGDGAHPYVERQYTTWWQHRQVVEANDGRRYSRRFLVSTMGNVDAAHTDSHLTDEYRSLKSGPSSWQTADIAGQLINVPNRTATASIRQIVWELLETFKQLGDLRSDG